MRNPVFGAFLAEMSSLHEAKNHDYANDGNPYSNFEQAAEVAAGFSGVDAVFAVLIGVKLARLRELTAAGKTPNNESIADTRKDLAMYAALWATYHRAEAPPDAPRLSYDDVRLASWEGVCLCGRHYTHPGECERTGECGALRHPHADRVPRVPRETREDTGETAAKRTHPNRE
jgi:hypothetical protein